VSQTVTFSNVNELTARDKDSNYTSDYTLAYDAVGNMTDDGEKYTYVYDAFGRLVTVKNRSTSAVVAEYKYNGLNQRIGSHDDTNASGTVDSSDPWYWFVQDSRWRTVATFRASSWGYSGSNDTSPKETTVYHAGGLGGGGGSSYIDSVILADKDMSNGWGGAADGTREKRVYLLQNWRADVSCVTDQNGKVVEWVKYSPYGVPFRIDPADFDRDGDVDSSDSSAFTTEYNNGGPRADANHDGFIDFTDFDVYDDNYNATTAGGRNVLSRGGSTSAGIHNRIGYAGYLWDSATSQYHVRNRVFLPGLGRWSRRDPIGYVDSLSVYEHVRTMPIVARDASGLKLIDGKYEACELDSANYYECLQASGGAWPGCNDSAFCCNMLNRQLTPLLTPLATCIGNALGTFAETEWRCIAGCLFGTGGTIVPEGMGYLRKGFSVAIFKYCALACTGANAIISAYEFSICYDNIRANDEMARRNYCLCMNKRASCPSPSQRSEVTCPARVNCASLGVKSKPEIPPLPDDTLSVSTLAGD